MRGARYRGDGAAIVALVPEELLPDDPLQLIGDSLLVPLAQGVVGARQLTDRCAEALRKRDWEGDDELAGQLEAVLGERPVAALRRVPVDLDELAGILEGDPVFGGGRIDIRTGEVWKQGDFDYARTMGEEDPDGEEPERWLWVRCRGSRDGYRDMEKFAGTVADADVVDNLELALDGRGPFRTFAAVLEASAPEELERWRIFSGERRRGRARAWLATAGYRTAVLRPPQRG